MVYNPFKMIFPKKSMYQTDAPAESSTSPPTNANSGFSSEVSPDSAEFGTTAATNAAGAGMSTAKMAAIIGVSAALAVAVLTTVITTSVILTTPPSTVIMRPESTTTTSTTKITTTSTTSTTTTATTTVLAGYRLSCSVSNQCNYNLGLVCQIGVCLCNATQYYNGIGCGKKCPLLW